MSVDTQSIKELTEEIAKAKAEFTEKGKVAFANISKELFERHPQLESFGWRQYTQYFNDGEPCYFSVHADRDYGLTINGDDVDELENIRKETYQATGKKVMQMQGWGANRKEVEVDEKKFLPNPDYDPVMGGLVDDVSDLVNGMPEDVMEQMFGDHVEVTVGRDGITIEDYSDHD